MSQPRQSQPVWLNTVFWLSALLSPTAYFLMVLLGAKFQLNLPQTFTWLLFCLIPVVALLICGCLVWSCSMTVARKARGMLFTLFAMLLQLAMILAVLRVILVTAIGYAQ